MKLPESDIKRIAVLRALQLGDMLCAVPAFRALRNAYPNAEIILLGLPWEESFVERFSHYIDSFIHFPGYPGLPEQDFNRDDWSSFVNAVNSQNLDLIIQMQGNGNIVNKMLKEFFPVTLAGFHSQDSLMGDDLFLTYPEGISEIDRHLSLMSYLGIASKGRYLEFPVYNTEQENLEALTLKLSPKKYICIHPGSRGSWRQWPTAHFALLGNEGKKLGFDIVITGTKEESEITSQVTEKIEGEVIDLTGRTGLGEVGQLIKDAYMLICNCTGVSHIAAATETPSIVISMDGQPERWGPINKSLHHTVDWTKEQDFEKVKNEMFRLMDSVNHA